MSYPTKQEQVRALNLAASDYAHQYAVCSKCGEIWQNIDFGCARHVLNCGYPVPTPLAVYSVGELVLVRPPVGSFDIPAEVVRLDGVYRCDVKYAAGNVENVGNGNLRPLSKLSPEARSYRRMRPKG